MRVSLNCLLENARAVDEKAVSFRVMRAVCAAENSDTDGLKGECGTVRLLDGGAKALRQVCAAILRFADEPISIQRASQQGAEGRVRELKGEKMDIVMPVQHYRGQKMFQRLDFAPRAPSIKVTSIGGDFTFMFASMVFEKLGLFLHQSGYLEPDNAVNSRK